jgi:hypothetical protein
VNHTVRKIQNYRVRKSCRAFQIGKASRSRQTDTLAEQTGKNDEQQTGRSGGRENSQESHESRQKWQKSRQTDMLAE